MVHNLFGDRFFGFRQPGWHEKGLVVMGQTGAEEAFDMIGSYEVFTRPIKVEIEPGVLITDEDRRAIIRTPTEDDPQHRIFGNVPQAYRLISMRQMCQLWDRFVKRPVETLGTLGFGETGFITTELPDISVNGDELRNYLFVDLDMTGESSLYIRQTPVRVVCQNTVIAGRSLSVENHRIHHRGDVVAQIRDILEGIYDRAVDKASVLKEAFEILAGTPVTSDDEEAILSGVYRIPNRPDTDDEKKILAWEMRRDSIEERRGVVHEIFTGVGRGSDHQAFKGTAWGLYNSVVELEDHGRGLSENARVVATVTGDKARIKERAWDVTVDHFQIALN